MILIEKKRFPSLKYVLGSLFVFFLFSSAWAQTTSLSGFLKDELDDYPLVSANVLLLKLPDSTIAQVMESDLNGKFSAVDVPYGKYVLKVLYVGYEDQIIPIELKDNPLVLPVLRIKPLAASRMQVTVTAQRLITQKGDTTQFSADAFKTNPDATAEDLVTKMPGVVMQDGKIQAQGENVTKVLVDGKPFFGDDPASVLKNLPADVIDKIQIFDQQSEQSQFTGFDDGNTSKTINIITKPEKRNGSFGRVYAGYGYEDVYKAGANVNVFEGDRRITVLGQVNNINEQNFSTDDLLGISSQSSGQRGRSGGGRNRNGGVNDFLVNAQNGVSKTYAFGINYTDKLGDKIDFSGSYFFNRSENKADNRLFRRYVLSSDSLQNYSENNVSTSENTNHRLNLRIDYKIDSSNSLLIIPRLSVQQNKGERYLLGETRRSELSLNNTLNDFNSNLLGIDFYNLALYRHKFQKKGRTFSVHLNTAYNNNSGDNDFLAQNNYFSGMNVSDTLDQQSSLLRNGYNLGSDLVYTEPLTKNSLLQFNYGFSYTENKSDKKTYNYEATAQDYSRQDTLLSNVFRSTYTAHKVGTGYRYQKEKYQLMVNLAYQHASLNNVQDFPFENDLSRSFINLLPSARFKYNITKTKNLRINYRTQTNAPNVEQLQQVLNNNNPLQLSTGNPDLKQDYQHRLFMHYTSTNTVTSTTFFTMLAGTYTTDYIANSTYIAQSDTLISGIQLLRGAQLTTRENTDGYFDVRSLVSYGKPIAFLKSNLNFNAFVNFSRTPGLINGKLNYAHSPVTGLGLVLSSNISENIDFTLSSNSNYNYVRNTLNKNSDVEFFNQNSRAKINIIFARRIVFNTEAAHQYNAGLSAGFNQNFLLWNAGLGLKFLKNNAGELRLTVFDILGQNNNVSRNITEVYNEDIRSNVLQRYAMLTFTYNFRKYKPAPSED